MVAVSADVSSNYLTLTGRQLIQTRPILSRNEGTVGKRRSVVEERKE